MHRIDSTTAVAALPVPRAEGTPGYFVNGDPAVGQVATSVTHEWLNSVQEEIAGVIETAGETLDKTNNRQLLAAIQQLISSMDGWSTGDVKITLKAAADAGWVLMNDGSIGNAASGATARANADTQALFTLLWTNVSNGNAALQTSAGGAVARGVSAAADFAANRRLVLPAVLGRSLAIAGAGVGLTARNLGDIAGAETHVLALGELPAHTHSGTTGNESANHTHSGTTGTESQSHTHSVAGTLNGGVGAASGGQVTSSGGAFNTGTPSQPHTHAITTGTESVSHTHAFTTDAGTGGGGAHSNMQPTAFLNVMIKL
ncbi:MAG TPA: hypothetical protein VGV37_06810 [Aliidongia sp.]|uniref:hypothetical protein n=1 Tax=Aliidongia sp. TaxID=1914230 RepID=UPI002DDDB5EA|nr:hypothetical protein [Aliidongia sp.]HEV2674237.1 hypothetical protein [Aliidongia sp.]